MAAPDDTPEDVDALVVRSATEGTHPGKDADCC
jgi:hypothetical protein